MTKKKRIGRPPLPRGKARMGRLFVRLLQTEVGEIKKAADRDGKSTSEWIRETLLGKARTGK
jgi:hypothetical protein